MAKFLGPTGLTVLWSRIKAWIRAQGYTTNTGTITEIQTTVGKHTAIDVTSGKASFNVPTTAEHIMYDANTTVKSKVDTIVSQGGEPNAIDSISLNGTNIAPDGSKNVDISLTGNNLRVEPPSEVGGESYDEEYNYISGGDSIRDALIDLDTALSNKTDNDTKNTAGATQVSFGSSETKMYLIGAKTMGNNPQTYADNGVYVTPEGDIVANGTNLNTGKTETVDGVSGDIITRYGECSTSASTSTKTVTLEEGTISSLSDGTRVTVNFINRNTDENPKLNVNNTGAHNIACFNGAFSPNDLYGIIDFIYINELWYIVQDVTAYSGIDNILDKIGQINGIASLDSSGKVPSSQLPSYVDDVIEVYARSGQTALSQNWLATGSASGTVVSPEAGKIYVLMNSGGNDYPINSQYRWGGTTYVKLNDGGCTEMTESEMNIAVMGSDTNVWT